MKNLLKQIKQLYRINPIIVKNGRIFHKSYGEILMERLVQIVFTVGVIGIILVILRLAFNF